MKNPFGMLVEDCDSVVVPVPGFLLAGPSTGSLSGKYVAMRGAFSGPLRVQVNSIANFHRTHDMYHVGLLVDSNGLLPATLRGAFLYEEGLLFRVFSARINRAPFSDAAAFRLVDGIARGIARVSQGILHAFVVGGGLAEGLDLWSNLKEIECLNGQRIQGSAIEPLGQTWAVPALRMYESQDETKIVTGSCGPATNEYPVAFLGADGYILGEVLTQQASGLIQARCGLKLSNSTVLTSVQGAERFEVAMGAYQ
jgi:hypothetical protein